MITLSNWIVLGYFCYSIIVAWPRVIAFTLKSSTKTVIVAGSTGYIGRSVVKDLVSRGVNTISLVRSADSVAPKTLQFLEGSTILECDVTNMDSLSTFYDKIKPDATICCLASRSGIKRDAWLVDYQASLNVLRAQESVSYQRPNSNSNNHFTLLSAYCCAKPLLQFQFAKLELETQLKSSQSVSHSIIRPTAFFKSLDGQIESIKKGYPALIFGDGSCAANPISESDLAAFLVASTLSPSAIGMVNRTRNVGGPDNPPIPKLQQIQLIYDALGISVDKRAVLSIPVAVLDALISIFASVESIAGAFSWSMLNEKAEDAAEIARIVKYYATEPMVAVSEGEIQGQQRIRDHFRSIAERGGNLEEIDKMTTTTGVFELLAKNEYSRQKPR